MSVDQPGTSEGPLPVRVGTTSLRVRATQRTVECFQTTPPLWWPMPNTPPRCPGTGRGGRALLFSVKRYWGGGSRRDSGSEGNSLVPSVVGFMLWLSLSEFCCSNKETIPATTLHIVTEEGAEATHNQSACLNLQVIVGERMGHTRYKRDKK